MIPQVTNHIWQSTVFALAAGLLTLAFRKNRAAVRYWLWLAASLKFLVPFALLIALGSRIDRTPSVRHSAPPVAYTVEQISEPFAAGAAAIAVKRQTLDWWTLGIFAAWLCGVLTIAFLRLRDWQHVHAALRASAPLDLPGAMHVRATPGLLEPGVVGLLDPVLLMPADIADRLTPHQLQAVLAHELSHIRRRDNLASAAHMAVEAMFWFHPLVWWIGARLIDERERACDEEVLRNGNEPAVYAEGILNVCKSYVESPLACVSGVTGSDLKRRIQAILSGDAVRELDAARKAILAGACAAALAVPVIVGVIAAPAIRAQSAAQSAKEHTPKWEAVAIHPCTGDAGGGKGRGAPPTRNSGRLSVNCIPVRGMIRSAYVTFGNGKAIVPGQRVAVEGGPGWIDSDRYQIVASAEAIAAGKYPLTEMLRGPMLQAILEDRFQLKIRRETREVPLYVLEVNKGGPKLQPHKEGNCVIVDADHPPPRPVPGGPLLCGAIWRGEDYIESRGSTMEDLASNLAFFLDRDVIDKTGLTGLYDIRIDGPSSELLPRPKIDPASGDAADIDTPLIFSAIKQVGLKLDATKGPGQFLIVEHVERPTEN